MSIENDIDELISFSFKKQVRALSNRARRFSIMLYLHKSKKWTRDNSSACFYTKSDVNGEEAAIYDHELQMPELCAGFAKYHDNEFPEVPWSESSPAWTKEEVPMTASHATQMDINYLAERFMDEHPWFHELDNLPFKSEDEDE